MDQYDNKDPKEIFPPGWRGLSLHAGICKIASLVYRNFPGKAKREVEFAEVYNSTYIVWREYPATRWYHLMLRMWHLWMPVGQSSKGKVYSAKRPARYGCLVYMIPSTFYEKSGSLWGVPVQREEDIVEHRRGLVWYGLPSTEGELGVYEGEQDVATWWCNKKYRDAARAAKQRVHKAS
jgi:hypothetical protein